MTLRSTLRVASTWDGTPVAAPQVALVTVSALDVGLRVEVDAPFHRDPPPPASPGPSDRLWEFEAVELFVALLADEVWRYLEIELSPHGHHLVLRFEGRRNAVDRALPLRYSAHIDVGSGRWRGDAAVPYSYLPGARPELGALRANAFAVHGPAGARVHLAATPLPGRAPDFHQPERFAPLFRGVQKPPAG